MTDPVLPTQSFDALLHAEPLEERLEFAAWDPPGDWSGEVKCTTDFEGKTTCEAGVTVT